MYFILENKTSLERERILTSSSWKGAKHPVEQREQLKGELIHQVLHEMRMDESKLSINQVHSVCSQGRDAHLPALLLSKGEGVVAGNTFLNNCTGKRHYGEERIEEIKTFQPLPHLFPPWGCVRWDRAVLPCGSHSVTAFTSLPSISSHTDSCWVKALYLVTGSLWDFVFNFYIL